MTKRVKALLWLLSGVSRFIRSGTYVACVAAGLLLSSCAGITPLPTRTKTPEYGELKQKVSANFIVPGQTTRADVVTNLKSVDAGMENNQFFLARWSSSNKGGWLFLCGYTNCVGGASRLWKTANALVEFDDADLVVRSAVFGDGSLVAKLSPLAAQHEAISFDPPQEIHVDHLKAAVWNPATLVLGKDTLALRESVFHQGLRHSSTSTLDFQINRTAVENVRTGLGSIFPAVHVRIHFSEKTKVGRLMNVQMSVSDLFLLLEFLNQHP